MDKIIKVDTYCGHTFFLSIPTKNMSFKEMDNYRLLNDGNWGVPHNEDGYAIEIDSYSYHRYEYRFLNLLHREDGPAIEMSRDFSPYWKNKYWYLSGHHYSFKGYCKTLKKYYGKTDADIFLLGLKYG